MTMTRSAFGLLLLVTAIATSAHADDAPYVPPDFMAQLRPLPETTDTTNVWKLDLAQALQVAIRQNLGVVLERESVAAATLGVDAAQGAYEPVVNASADHSTADQPPTSAQAGMPGTIIANRASDWSLSVVDKLPTGGKVEVDFLNSRLDSNAGTAVEPVYNSSTVQATITQPLARGFSTDLVVPRVDLLRARITSQRERAQLEVAAADVIVRTEGAYWDLVLALFSYDLQLRSQRRAEDQLALTQRQIASGINPPSDLISAQSTLAQRQLQLVQAEQQIEASSDALRAVLNLPREDWSRPIVPVELPTFVAQSATAEQALAVALKHRPELIQTDLDLQTALLGIRQAENAKLPQLDLGVTTQLFGADSTYGGALAGVGRTNATGYGVTLNLSWTPLQRASSAAVKIQRVNQQQAVVRREQLVQGLWFAVRDALRSQSGAARQVSAAAKFRALATENLEVEHRKFVAGTSSNFIVAQRQEDLANAQLAELQAVLNHKKATAALLQAMGTLLEQRHVLLH